MRSLRIAILWIIGILLWVFGLTIGLAWFQFGYLDWKTIATMGVILVPVLGVAIGVLVWTHVHEAAEQEAQESKKAATTETPTTASTERAVRSQPAKLQPTRHITSHL